MRRAAITALLVGTILCLINQWQALLGRAAFDWIKALLSYAVPFAVARVSGYLALREFASRAGPQSLADAAEEVRGLVSELGANASRVNAAAKSGLSALDQALLATRALEAASKGRAGAPASHIAEAIEALERLRAETDAALQGSATNMGIARKAESLLGAGA